MVQKATWTQYGKNMGKITVIRKLRKWSPPEIEDVQEPFCGNRRKNLVPFSQTHPEVADEWLYKKNCGWTPDDFSAGSGCNAYWECPKCLREYKRSVHNRTDGHGCPYCASRIVCDETSLLKKFPEIAAQWHPTKNKALKVDDLTSGSKKRVWWLCEKCNHVWNTPVYSRTTQGRGCPACFIARREYTRLHFEYSIPVPVVLNESSRSPSEWYERESNQGFESLYKFSKALAKQWHPTKNGKVTARNIAKNSRAIAWWLCQKGLDHEWQAKVADRARSSKAGCPFCLNRSPSVTNMLNVKAPEVAKEWHPTKNGAVKPEHVIAGGVTKYWFQCKKDASHEWESKLNLRIAGSKCPYCTHNRVSKDNCLSETFPEIAAQLHPTKNGKIDTSKIAAKSHKKLWWVCPEGPDHIWEAAPATRTKGNGCPCCSGRQRSITNCLATLQPETAAQWHPTKNKSMTPFKVSPFSKELAWWLCSKGHKWQQPIAQRAGATVICWQCFRDSRSS